MNDKMMLTKNVHALLCEALRRYTQFHKDKSLTNAWTGLGSKTTYAPAINGGYMVFDGMPKPRCDGWLYLTDKGAEIVRQWIDAGFEFEQIEAGNLPPREV